MGGGSEEEEGGWMMTRRLDLLFASLRCRRRKLKFSVCANHAGHDVSVAGELVLRYQNKAEGVRQHLVHHHPLSGISALTSLTSVFPAESL